VRNSTSASGSQPSGNTKNDRILQTPSSNSKNKVEAHPRNVKSSLNKRNGAVNVKGSAVVQNLKKQDNSDSICVNSNDCMSSDNLCVSNSMNDVKSRAKSKKHKSKKDSWKPTGKMTTTVVNNSFFRGFFEKQKLTRPNFIDWYRKLRIVLSSEDKLNYLELPIPAPPVLAVAGQQVPPETLAAHATWVKGQKEIVVLMLMTMEPDLQRNLETLGACDMLKDLKTLFSQQAGQELLQTARDFVKNYNMHGMGKMVNELHAMLKLHEQTLPKRDAPALHAVRAGKVQKKNKNKKLQLAARGKNQGKRKSKLAYAPKPKIPPPPKKEDPAKDLVCYHYSDTGHWKQNCPQYLSELLKNKKLPQGASTSGIFTKELFTFLRKSWVYDTGCRTHICNTIQGLRGSRKPKPGALSLYIRNGQSAAIEAIGSYDLCFPSGLGILNMVPTKKVEKTPYEPDKLEPRSIKCIFVRYPKEIIGYSFYYPPENKVFVARNAEFFENSLITQEASESLEELEIIQEEDTHPSENTSSHHDEGDQEIDETQSDIIPIRRSTRTRHVPDRMCLNIKADEYELGDLNEPANYKATLLDYEFDKWLNAMNVEMQYMNNNEVWDLVDLLPNGKTVGSKWLFKKKTGIDEAVHTYKARLVAKVYDSVNSGDIPLCELCPRLFALDSAPNICVAVKMAGPLDTSFRRSVRGGVEQQEFSDLSSFLNSVVLSTSNDRWYFSLSSSGEFSVKDTRLAIDDLVLPSHSEPTRWVKLIPIKINVFMWRARRGCLPTRYNLVQKGVILESTSCPVCFSDEEDVHHLLFRCSLSQEVLHRVCRWWEIDFQLWRSFSEWDEWFSSIRLPGSVKGFLEGVFYVAWWFIWGFRNRSTFDVNKPSRSILFENIVSSSFLWCNSRCSRKFSRDDWLKNPHLISL
ncbi:retrovirus-related pol polyprotein from transposon TNT 1-94, partial [Tanacetum coccineum]